MVIEMASEETRATFKKDPKHKGLVDDTGLFGVVRHPNYLGYLIWRTGAGLVSGSLGAGVFAFASNLGFFLYQSIPGLSKYMSQRYGEQYTSYEKRVPYKLIPGIV